MKDRSSAELNLDLALVAAAAGGGAFRGFDYKRLKQLLKQHLQQTLPSLNMRLLPILLLRRSFPHWWRK
jgi:hypothetical protein